MLVNKRIRFSYKINKIRYELLYVTILSILVFMITNKYQNMLPEMLFTIQAFFGTAISMLLFFKLSQSFDRWSEVQKVWDVIVNDSRRFMKST